MRQLFALFVLGLITTTISATPTYHPSGSKLTTGNISASRSILMSTGNPAASATVLVQEKSQYRFGILSSAGFGYEFGNFPNLVQEIDDTIDKLSNSQTQDISGIIVQAETIPQNVQRVTDDLNTKLIAPINTLMNTIEADGNFKGFGAIHIPLMPLVITHKKIGGSIFFDINGSVSGNMGFISDPMQDFTTQDVVTQVTAALDPLSTSTDISFDLPNSDSTLLIRGAAVVELAFGYSKQLKDHKKGKLFGGVRGKYYSVGLTQFAKRLADFATNEGAEDTFNDTSDEDYEKSTGFGVDVGVLWVSEKYRLGATVVDLNQPSFDYNIVDTSTYTNQTVIDKLQKGESYQMKAQVQLEGAIHTENQNWVVGGSVDANSAEDPFGQEYQWFAISAAYAPRGWLSAGVRVGYRANMAGSKLSYATFGFTAFNVLNLDIAYGLESITVEEDSDLTSFSGDIPRSFIANLGLEITF